MNVKPALVKCELAQHWWTFFLQNDMIPKVKKKTGQTMKGIIDSADVIKVSHM